MKSFIKIPIIIAIGFSLMFQACGSDNSNTSEFKDHATSSTAPQPSSTSACIGLANCSPPAGTMFSFTQPVLLGLNACTITKAKLLATGSNFIAILKANCQGSFALYSLKVSGDGTALGTPALISRACDERTNPVDKFAVDRGSASILAAYSCNASSTSMSKNLHISVLNLDGAVVVSKNNIRTAIAAGFAVKWHDASTQFALALPTLLQRYSAAGQEIGGAVILPQASYSGEDIADLRVSRTSWQVIKGTSYGALNCSKVLSAGNLTCTNQTLNAYRTAESQELLISTSYSYGLTRSLFSPETCKDTRNMDIGNGSEIDAQNVYGSLSIPGNYYAALVLTRKQTLAVAVFQRDASTIAVMNPVSNVNTPTDVQLGTSGDGKMFVMWVEGNVVKMVRATE